MTSQWCPAWAVRVTQLPAALQAAGYQLFPINPLAVSRYRDSYVASQDLGVSLVGTAAEHDHPG